MSASRKRFAGGGRRSVHLPRPNASGNWSAAHLAVRSARRHGFQQGRTVVLGRIDHGTDFIRNHLTSIVLLEHAPRVVERGAEPNRVIVAAQNGGTAVRGGAGVMDL